MSLDWWPQSGLTREEAEDLFRLFAGSSEDEKIEEINFDELPNYRRGYLREESPGPLRSFKSPPTS